jgi:serine/threonine protein kinase
MPPAAVVPLTNSISGLPRSSFHTAPPHPLPPSQVHRLREYHTDPQPRDVQPRETATGYGMHFDRAVDLSNIMVILPPHYLEKLIAYIRQQPSCTDDHTQMNVDQGDLSHSNPHMPMGPKGEPVAICDDTAVSLIRNCVKLNPTTYFYPDKVEALVTITSLPANTVRKVISQILEECLRDPSRITSSSEYSKSSIATSESLRTTNQSLSSATTTHSQPARVVQPHDPRASHEHTSRICSSDNRPILQQAAEFLLDSTSRNCRPTSDKSLLLRDEEKKYQCTFKCGKNFTRKEDLKRHEEEKNYPQEGWICNVEPVVTVDNITTCAYCRLSNPSMSHAPDEHRNLCHERELGAVGKIFLRKKRFEEHYKAFHPALPVTEYVNRCHFIAPSELPKWCGFCERSHHFDGLKARNHHMAKHFEEGLDMTKWKDPCTSGIFIDDGDDDDADGDGDENDYDADHDMGDVEDEDRTSHDYQPNGGTSNEVQGQSNSGNVNNSFSTLALEEYGHNNLMKAVIKLPQNSANNFVDDLTTKGDVTTQKKEDTLPVLLSHAEDHVHMSRNNQRMLSSLSQQDIIQDETTGRPRTRSSGTRGSTLEEDLWNARVTYKSHRSFIPITELKRLITVDRVSRELHVHDPNILPIEIVNKAEIIVENATRLFALLILIGKEQDITSLIEEGIKDGDLPISGLRCKDIQVFSQWKPKAVKDFKQDQWSVISPIFDKIGEHYELDDHTILPFIENKERPEQLIAGGYSDVRSVRIHPAHLDLSWSTRPLVSQSILRDGRANTLQYSAPFIAVKRLHSTDPTNFEKEARMLRELAKEDHPHIIKLLATYRMGGHYHLMFPWADKNLRTYWQDDPKPKWSQEALLWDIRQMLGIASGLQTIHNFKIKPHHRDQLRSLVVPGIKTSIGEEEYWYGRHGDLKPENILWSNGLDCCDALGILQIADFGLGRFHGRASRSQVDPRTIASTPTYEPPEIALNLKVSRAYDIWSLGCIILEFLTWRLGGYKLLEEFGNSRLTTEEDGVIYDKFYTLKDLSPLPTRVINVGDIDTDPYLQETAGEYGHYIALSYCSGTKSRITTTIKSIEERKRHISFSTLPTMFRDAIYLCRTSGVRYLWADSLCIIQDSWEDREAEMRRMSAVYQGALFTIVAATPEYYGEGLLIKSKRNQALGHIKHAGPDMGKTCVVQEAVLQWIIRLRCHSRCSGVIRDLLDLVKDYLLVVDTRKRITSTVLLEKLQGIASRAEADKAYLLSPVLFDINLNITENARNGKTLRDNKLVNREELLNRLNALITTVDGHDSMTLAGIGDKV